MCVVCVIFPVPGGDKKTPSSFTKKKGKKGRGGEKTQRSIPVLSVQPRTKPRGVSPEGAALSPTALGVKATGGALRPRRPGQSPPSDPGAQCRQPGGARSSDEAGLGEGEPPRVPIGGVLAGNVRTLRFQPRTFGSWDPRLEPTGLRGAGSPER